MELLNYPFDGALILQKKRALRRELLAREGLLDKKIAIVSGSTIGDIKPVLELFLLNKGIRPAFWEGGYGLFYENLVFGGELAAFAPDVLYIHTSARNLLHWPAPADSAAEADAKLGAEHARFAAAWDAAQSLGCPVVQNNFEPPAWRNFGSLDAQHPAGRTRHARRMNEKLAAYAAAHPGFYVHDLAYLAACEGAARFCADAAWYAYKYAVAPEYIPALCHSLASLVGALFGLSKKGVVTDLDNTLWGGVIGEAGPEGVELGSETPAGMAYAEVQAYLKMLAGRGILLSAASKNEPAAAESGLAREDAPLKKDDFLCFEANWGPKSQSVARIAKTLNVGADSLLFLDDNPAEREEVRRALPAVAAPPVAQPEDTVRLLDRGGWFEAAALSADDVARGEMYRQNARRAVAEAAFADYGAYLKSLEMAADIGPFAPAQLERITQLINKTNQFNLTTRRYTAAEVEQRAQSPAYVTLAARLADKFGDNGLVTALIAARQGDALDIELWVMSCRVFGRGLEHTMFDALVAEARRAGVSTITGSWLPTPKNLLVRDFYATIGFEPVAETAGRRDFSYTVPAVYTPLNKAIEVHTAGNNNT